jgi:hypothetical protein
MNTYIDLNIINNQAIDYVIDWKIHDQESCSGHKIIKYGIGKGNDLFQQTGSNNAGARYTVTQRGTEKFQRIFIQIVEQLLHGPNTVEAGVKELDEVPCQRVRSAPNTEEIVKELQKALDKECKSSFTPNRTTMTTKKGAQHKSVSW